MAAEQVSATFPGGAGFNLAKKVAETSSEAAEELRIASQKNGEAITAINTALTDYQAAFEGYQKEVNERFADLNEPAIPTPVMTVNRTAVVAAIQAANEANSAAQIKSDALRDLAVNARQRDGSN